MFCAHSYSKTPKLSSYVVEFEGLLSRNKDVDLVRWTSGFGRWPTKISCANSGGDRSSRPMKNGPTPRACGFVAVLLSVAFLWTLALSASPQLHERFHLDANRADHVCAAVFVASGSYEHSLDAALSSAPIPFVHFSKLRAADPQSVPSLFLSARIFEHAPPALS
jgi:hypothetical protein